MDFILNFVAPTVLRHNFCFQTEVVHISEIGAVSYLPHPLFCQRTHRSRLCAESFSMFSTSRILIATTRIFIRRLMSLVRLIFRISLPFLFARHHSCRSSSSLSPRLSAEIGGAASPGGGGGGRRPGDGAASQEGPPRPRHLRRRPRRHRSPGAGTRVRR